MRDSYVKILFLIFPLVFIPAQAALASPVAAEPPNSFTVEFTSDDGLNITTNILISEERISGLVYRLDMGEMDVIEIEDMLETIIEECFKEQMAQWRKYEGYPRHLAELADIEEYEIDSTRRNGFYQLRYKLHLRSRHVMRTLDPTFDFRWEDDRISMFLMLHFPFPDIPLADGVSIYELAPDTMQYIVILPLPLAIPKRELGDIPGFLSATAYSASFLVHPDEYIPIRLIGQVGRDEFPSTRNVVEFEARDDHSGTLSAKVFMAKDDLKRICQSGDGIELVDALNIIREQYEDSIGLTFPDWIEHSYRIETDETSTDLIFKITVEINSLVEANVLEGFFEYAVIGDWTFVDLPLHNPFDPAKLPFCEGANLRLDPCTFIVTMPGRINNANEIRGTGLQFKVDGGSVWFHLPGGDNEYVSVSSDSLGF